MVGPAYPVAMDLTIKDVADRTGLSAHTIRYYCDQGLVPSVQRDSNNQRLFNEDCLGWLEGVKVLRECGMSIADVRAYVQQCLRGDETLSERMELIEKYAHIADAQLLEAQARADYLRKKLAYYAQIRDGLVPDTTDISRWGRR